MSRDNHSFRSRSPLAIPVALCGALLCSCSALAQSGENEPANVQPVVVVTDGLVAGSEVLLEGGTVLPVGESLLPGDIVVGGALVNVANETKVVLIAAEVEFIYPGDVLLTLDPGTPAWRCACKCGGSWRVLNVSAPDCGLWGGGNLIGVACIDPNTNQPSAWTECIQVFDIPTP